MKDRGVYETPGGTILYKAHELLEMITVDKDTLHAKQKLAVDFADLVYNGKWFSPLREALSAFADKTRGRHIPPRSQSGRSRPSPSSCRRPTPICAVCTPI